MVKSAASSAAWNGVLPVCSDGFAFADGEFFAETSGQNRHRRATPAELKAHFTSGGEKDHPAHWFEAQLVHYGLKPSKTKSVARMRLLDAVNSGRLHVPSHLVNLESQLKKDWTTKSREAKKALAEASKPTPKKATSSSKTSMTGSKRKIELDNGVTININFSGSDTPVQPPAKKPKATPTKATKTTAKPSSVEASKSATPVKKQTARRGGISQGSGRSVSQPATVASPARGNKQTARRGGLSQGLVAHRLNRLGPRRLRQPIPTKQTARRSGAWMARGRIPTQDSQDDDNSSANWDSRSESSFASAGQDSHDELPPPYSAYGDESQDLEPLGLLNGDYEVDSRCITDQWSCYGSDFDLTLTLAGSRLWGSFDLGVISGIMFFETRPWRSSEVPMPFIWRGQEADGPIMYGNDHHGSITFLGGGRVEGRFDYQRLTFQADRFDGQDTRSSRDARSMKSEWDGYTEAEYDRLNRARWG
ncbi:hypothetical protein HIM_10820 [Hirsutella minnesotensis 3608]|uniref:Uncharacterized protein n=1 Tax=Hirsutella minnesotensis 3608 TaxID=1043627 RepID=A0A0F7ZFV1_9HYPO|nr:hypothetical protein HIM_10820 [Hirsutella minnesotensis 3608]